MEHMSYAKGISWFDDCRIPFEDTQNPATNPKYRLEGGYKLAEKGKISDGSITQFRSSLNEIDVRGRFPANILVCDDMLNDGLPSGNKWKKNYGSIDYKGLNYSSSTNQCLHGGGYTGNNTYADSGSSSRYYDIDKWFENLLDSCE